MDQRLIFTCFSLSRIVNRIIKQTYTEFQTFTVQIKKVGLTLRSYDQYLSSVPWHSLTATDNNLLSKIRFNSSRANCHDTLWLSWYYHYQRYPCHDTITVKGLISWCITIPSPSPNRTPYLFTILVLNFEQVHLTTDVSKILVDKWQTV